MNSLTKRHAVAAILVCVCAAYALAASRQLRAAVAASTGEVAGLETAVQLEPQSAEYQNALGRMYAFSVRPEAMERLESAAALNPHAARYWIDLASAAHILDMAAPSPMWLQRAMQADPKNPSVAWEAGTISIADDELNGAVEFWQKAVEQDSVRRPLAIDLALRAGVDENFVRDHLVPMSSKGYLQFLNALLRRDRADAAQRTWNKLLQLRQPVELSETSSYLQFLLDRGESASAWRAWNDLLALSPALNAYGRSENNLTVNAGFELPLLNSGFDWRGTSSYKGAIAQDPVEPHSGNYSLRLTYEMGSQPDPSVEELLPVTPKRMYRLSAYLKCEALESASGPRLVVGDYYAGSFQTLELPECLGTQPWHEVSASFATSPDTHLLRLSLGRDSQKLIRGRVWIDDVSLETK